jgi:hypothetical protein
MQVPKQFWNLPQVSTPWLENTLQKNQSKAQEVCYDAA